MTLLASGIPDLSAWVSVLLFAIPALPLLSTVGQWILPTALARGFSILLAGATLIQVGMVLTLPGLAAGGAYRLEGSVPWLHAPPVALDVTLQVSGASAILLFLVALGWLSAGIGLFAHADRRPAALLSTSVAIAMLGILTSSPLVAVLLGTLLGLSEACLTWYSPTGEQDSLRPNVMSGSENSGHNWPVPGDLLLVLGLFPWYDPEWLVGWLAPPATGGLLILAGLLLKAREIRPTVAELPAIAIWRSLALPAFWTAIFLRFLPESSASILAPHGRGAWLVVLASLAFAGGMLAMARDGDGGRGRDALAWRSFSMFLLLLFAASLPGRGEGLVLTLVVLTSFSLAAGSAVQGRLGAWLAQGALASLPGLGAFLGWVALFRRADAWAGEVTSPLALSVLLLLLSTLGLLAISAGHGLAWAVRSRKLRNERKDGKGRGERDESAGEAGSWLGFGLAVIASGAGWLLVSTPAIPSLLGSPASVPVGWTHLGETGWQLLLGCVTLAGGIVGFTGRWEDEDAPSPRERAWTEVVEPHRVEDLDDVVPTEESISAPVVVVVASTIALAVLLWLVTRP